MKKTFPENRKLGGSERLRLFDADKQMLKHAARQSGIAEEELKRRAIHVGLPQLARLLGLEMNKLKQAA